VAAVSTATDVIGVRASREGYGGLGEPPRMVPQPITFEFDPQRTIPWVAIGNEFLNSGLFLLDESCA